MRYINLRLTCTYLLTYLLNGFSFLVIFYLYIFLFILGRAVD